MHLELHLSMYICVSLAIQLSRKQRELLNVLISTCQIIFIDELVNKIVSKFVIITRAIPHFSVHINAAREHVVERPSWEHDRQEAAYRRVFFSGTIVRVRDDVRRAIDHGCY